MTREQQLQNDLIEDMRQWSSDKMYNTFGSWLETIVNREKEKLQLQLKTIWRNRTWYANRETGERFDPDTMRFFFSPKKISKYSLSEMETILEKIEHETLFSNPKS